MAAEKGAERAPHAPVTYGLLGRTLKHSWSPQIHEGLGTTPYELIELEPDELAAFVREGSWKGLNCTIPYKRDLIPLVDELRPTAARIGAVNTLLHDERGRIIGDNTDMFGFAWTLKRFCERHLGGLGAIQGAKALVLGSGGASRAIVCALEDVGAVPVVISRHGDETYEGVATRHADAALIVNTTPVGMYPNCPASPLDDDTLAHITGLRGVIDVVYNPEHTGIMLAAERMGVPSESGLVMLVGQAWLSSSMWQGRELDEGLIGSINERLMRSSRNVALIGMPGSGKTSAGRNLAELCGRTFVDMDVNFSERFGRTPAEVIETDGEQAFRAMETQALSEVARGSGLVISCGGGVVTRPENRDLLRQNSTVVMVDRKLDQLSSKGRPISKSRGIEALAAERMPLYRAWADEVVACTGSARGDAQEIMRRLSL